MKAVILREELVEIARSLLEKNQMKAIIFSLRFKDYVANYCLTKLDCVVNAKGINFKAKFKESI